MLNLDRLSLNYILIGFSGTILIAALVGWMISMIYSFLVIVLYLVSLAFVLNRNNKHL